MDETREMISYLNKKILKEFDNKFHLDDRGIVLEFKNGADINVCVNPASDGYIVGRDEYFEEFKYIDDVIDYLTTQGVPVRENKKEFSWFCKEYEHFSKMIMLMFEDKCTIYLWGIKYRVKGKIICIEINQKEYPLMTIKKFKEKKPDKLIFEETYDAYVSVTTELVKSGVKGKKNSIKVDIPDDFPFYLKNE